jgi:hypothetical protein
MAGAGLLCGIYQPVAKYHQGEAALDTLVLQADAGHGNNP